jgi:hypothetical protein
LGLRRYSFDVDAALFHIKALTVTGILFIVRSHVAGLAGLVVIRLVTSAPRSVLDATTQPLGQPTRTLHSFLGFERPWMNGLQRRR